MKTPKETTAGSASGVELILMGLVLALLGAMSTALMVLGLSYIYVGVYGLAFMLLGGWGISGFVFFKAYGPFLQRLELRAPRNTLGDNDTVDERPLDQDATASAANDKPLPTGVIVALATASYGLLIMLGALFWTQGPDLVLNLIAGGVLVGVAVGAWCLSGTDAS